MFNRKSGMPLNTMNTQYLGQSGIQDTSFTQDTPTPEPQMPQVAPSVPVQQPSQPMFAAQMAPALAMQAMNVPQPTGWANPMVAQFGGGKWGRTFMTPQAPSASGW